MAKARSLLLAAALYSDVQATEAFMPPLPGGMAVPSMPTSFALPVQAYASIHSLPSATPSFGSAPSADADAYPSLGGIGLPSMSSTPSLGAMPSAGAMPSFGALPNNMGEPATQAPDAPTAEVAGALQSTQSISNTAGNSAGPGQFANLAMGFPSMPDMLGTEPISGLSANPLPGSTVDNTGPPDSGSAVLESAPAVDTPGSLPAGFGALGGGSTETETPTLTADAPPDSSGPAFPMAGGGLMAGGSHTEVLDLDSFLAMIGAGPASDGAGPAGGIPGLGAAFGPAGLGAPGAALLNDAIEVKVADTNTTIFTTGDHPVTTINGVPIDSTEVHTGNDQRTMVDFDRMSVGQKGAFNGANIYRETITVCQPHMSEAECNNGGIPEMPYLEPYPDVEEVPPMMEELPPLTPPSSGFTSPTECAGGAVTSLEAYAGCVQIVGGLSFVDTNFVNLDPLSTVTSIVAEDTSASANPPMFDSGLGDPTTPAPAPVNGLILILSDNSVLANINGLQNLAGVLPGGVYIAGNPVLANVDSLVNILGLDGMDSAQHAVTIINNGALTDLNGFSGVTGKLPGGIVIEDNDALTTTCGFQNVAEIAADNVGLSVTLVNNAVVEDVCLSSATNLAGGLMMVDNPSIPNTNKMCKLTHIGADANKVAIQITNHASLTDISCLSTLTGALEGAIQIKGNPGLKNLTGLDNFVGIGKDIVNGTSLVAIESGLESLSGVAQVAEMTGAVLLKDNQNLISADMPSLISIGQTNEGESYLIEGNTNLVDFIALPVSIPGGMFLTNNPGMAKMEIHATTLGANTAGISADITNSGLTDLSGLNPVMEFAGGIVAAQNDNLNAINAGHIDSIGCESAGVHTGVAVEFNSNNALQEAVVDATQICGGSLFANNAGMTSLDLSVPDSLGADLSGNSLTIQNQPDLTTCTTGTNPTTFEGGFVAINAGMTNMAGMASVTSMGGGITMAGCMNLESTEGLNLNSVGASPTGNSLLFAECPMLTNTAGFENVNTSLPGAFVMENCPACTNVTSITSVAGIGQNANNQSILLNNTGATDMSGFGAVIACAGSVTIEHNQFLETLWGIENIETIGSDNMGNALTLVHNEVLASLEGLRSCTLIEGALVLKQLPMLKTLEGLQKLETIEGTNVLGDSIMIIGNPKLEALSGIDNLHGSLAGAITIDSNAVLTSTNGLQGITSVGTNLYGNSIELSNNAALTDMAGFGGITGNVQGAIYIDDNTVLDDCEGLSGIESISGYNAAEASLVIVNSKLKNLTCLCKLGGFSPGGLVVSGNSELSDVSGLFCQNPISSAGTVVIEGVRCLSSEETARLGTLCTSSTCHNSIQAVTKCYEGADSGGASSKVLVGDGVGRVCGGKSASEWQLWQAFGSSGLYLDVDTSACDFKITPAYVSSMMGDSAHWQLVGVNSIYSATKTGFRVYVWHPVLRGSFMQFFAAKYKWQISWMANTGRHGGLTKAGNTGWKQFALDTVVADVDTTACGYEVKPSYVAALHGAKDHWRTQGAHSLYFPTKTGFRVYIMHGSKNMTAAEAETNGWAIGWIGSTDAKHSGFSTSDWHMMCGSKDFECSPTAHFFSLYNDVSTTGMMGAPLFAAPPAYVTSVSGKAHHLVATGGASVYRATATGFRTYMDKAPTPDVAKDACWKVNWIGYETPRDCTTSTWTEWTDCTKTCGSGTQKQTRTQLSAASFQGNCQLEKTRACNTDCCVQNEVGHFSEWSDCSKTCGDAVRTRNWNTDIEPSCDGSAAVTDPSLLTQRCDFAECDSPCVYGDWTDSSPCSASCGNGEKTQTRDVSVMGAGIHRDNCVTTQKIQCNPNPCPSDCVVSEWDYEVWSDAPCSAPCVTYTQGANITTLGPYGTKRRTRTVTSNPIFGGKACPGLDDERVCGDHFCPYHCVFELWGTWKSPTDPSKTCSETCGSGVQKRTRVITYQAKHGGSECPATAETQECNAHCCAKAQVASNFSAWGQCSRSCEYGTQSRYRTQISPASCGGEPVSGHWSETRLCNHHCCPKDAVASEDWSAPSACSKSCNKAGEDTGTITRTKTPIRLAECGGKPMPLLVDTQVCPENLCPVHADCQWGNYTACSASCGTGVKTRTSIVISHALDGGWDCPAPQTINCNEHLCPTDCVVSSWSNWDSYFDGKSKLRRTRTILVEAQLGGKICPSLVEYEEHTVKHCTDRVTYGDWSACTKVCGTGYKYRYHQKMDCSLTSVVKYHMTFRQGKHCNNEACTVDADWDALPIAVTIPPLHDPIPHPTLSRRLIADAAWVDLTEAEVAEYGLGEGNWQTQH
jgi:hypothetical protein